MNEQKKREKGASLPALQACFKSTLPVMAGYVFLGITYGILMRTSGFPWWLSALQALILYTGSMEFLMVAILTSSFNPVSAAVTALMVGARHLFYGLAMLPKYNGTGWKKPYLIFATSDETFAVNYSADIPNGIDHGWYYFWVSLLDQLYWVAGALVGGLAGGLITINTEGLDFMMTAMFTVIFMDQWTKDSEAGASHLPSLIGVAASVACLLIFGADHFIVPTMLLILALLTLMRPRLEKTLLMDNEEYDDKGGTRK